MLLLSTSVWSQSVGKIYLRGRIEDSHDVFMEITYADGTCTARAECLRSHVVFNFGGSISKDSVFLSEMNEKFEAIAYLKGRLIKNNAGKYELNGKWTNLNESFGHEWILVEAAAGDKQVGFCGDDKWVRHFQGSFHGQLIDLILQKETEKRVRGVLYFEETRRSFPLTGYSDGDNLEFGMESPVGDLLGVFQAKANSAELLTCDFTNVNGQKESIVFYQRDRLDVGCMEYMDYSTAFEITYPRHPHNDGFNLAVGQIAENKVRYYRTYCAAKNAELDKKSANSRLMMRTNSWWQLDFVSDKIVSGLLSFSSTWENEVSTFDYNYDVTNNVLIELEDIFYVSGTNFRNEIMDYIMKELEKRPYGKDPTFTEWIAKEKFFYYTIQHDGVRFHSNFNALFGRQSVTVPYYILKTYAKPKSVIFDLIH